MSNTFQIKTYDIHTLPFNMLTPHWHDDFEVVYILTGKLAFHINHKTYLISAGEGFFINAGQIHYAKEYQEYDCCFLTFCIHPSMLYQTEQNPVFEKYILPATTNPAFCYVPLIPRIPWQKYILETIKKMIEICNTKSYGYEFKIQHFTNEIFYYILQNIASLSPPSKKEQKDITRIKHTMTYLEKSYTEKHSLEDISNTCNLSRSECCRLFQRILNCSPIDYVTKLRIRHSLPLILAHEKNMATIAKEVGFSGGSYFSETFKKVMGCTPLQFRCNEKKHDVFI